ncbi:response regulator transcription factor [Paenibacillus thiaminolyticus]|uniref:response regulator transcription factor n=1 Tax=Paenibacillus thiaminolyticus TaxID=49283 RepID=UPI00232E6CC1|nr:response regulator transcription factor [Paenibacillus thiaminolyticus]WCF09963.1 response regulator transcription factor [Paenibacillus thiaminolyticus]
MNIYEGRILIVEDDSAIGKMVRTVLGKEGFTDVVCAASGEEAVRYCASHPVHLIVLDVMLPGKSGFELAPFLREATDAPIIFVTARTTDLDKLTGFALGGDDYMTKPFNPLELAARVKAQLKRYLASAGKPAPEPKAAPAARYVYGRFSVDEAAGELRVAGVPVECPAMVFQLLLFFCRHPNRMFTKQELYERVWGCDAMSDDNTVMVHIHRIRERIEEVPGRPRLLVTVRGMGYKLVPPEQDGGGRSSGRPGL